MLPLLQEAATAAHAASRHPLAGSAAELLWLVPLLPLLGFIINGLLSVAAEGVITPIAGPLFKDYLLAFEVTSILLLSAIVGAVVLGKQRSASAGGSSAR